MPELVPVDVRMPELASEQRIGLSPAGWAATDSDPAVRSIGHSEAGSSQGPAVSSSAAADAASPPETGNGDGGERPASTSR